MIKRILEEGKKSGFNSTEVFRKKIDKEIFTDNKEFKTRQSIKTDRLIVRAFRETGEPVGFTLSAPNIKKVREAFQIMYSSFLPDGKKNYQNLLPSKVNNVNINIYDGDTFYEINEKSFGEMKEKLFENQAAFFPGLKIERMSFSKMLKKVYLTNSIMFKTERPKAKYKKTYFNLSVIFSYNDNIIEIIESKSIFSQIDYSRIVSKAFNLLNSLTENTKISVPVKYLILSPEVASTMLREFSEYFKINSKRKLKSIYFPQALSIVDNPQLNEQSNFIPFDDEGVQSGENFLIEKGFIKNRISNIKESFSKNILSTGNGFRTQKSIFPEVRFSNLYIKPSSFPFSKLHSDAVSGILISLIKIKRIQNGIYTFSAYGFEFNNDDINTNSPVHIYIQTDIESFFLRFAKVSKEVKFFHKRINVGSPYVLLEPGKKTGNMFKL